MKTARSLKRSMLHTLSFDVPSPDVNLKGSALPADPKSADPPGARRVAVASFDLVASNPRAWSTEYTSILEARRRSLGAGRPVLDS